jgi:hypothetical protein
MRKRIENPKNRKKLHPRLRQWGELMKGYVCSKCGMHMNQEEYDKNKSDCCDAPVVWYRDYEEE